MQRKDSLYKQRASYHLQRFRLRTLCCGGSVAPVRGKTPHLKSLSVELFPSFSPLQGAPRPLSTSLLLQQPHLRQ